MHQIGGGYTGNGFSTNNVKSLFSNTSVFAGIQPARYSGAGVSITKSTNAGIRTTGQQYWLATSSGTYGLWSVLNAGTVTSTNNFLDDIGVRPVVSLVSNVIISDGSGTETSPYTLEGITY